jgi:hypothetical protein
LLGFLFDPEDGGHIFIRHLPGLHLTTRRDTPEKRTLNIKHVWGCITTHSQCLFLLGQQEYIRRTVTINNRFRYYNRACDLF